MKLTIACAVLLTTFALTGCGGGGGANSPASVATDVKLDSTPIPVPVVPGSIASTSTFQIAAAMTGLSQMAQAYTLTAVDLTGNIHALIIGRTIGSSAVTFESHTATTITSTEIFRSNDVVVDQEVITDYLQASPFVPYGYLNQTNGTYAVRDAAYQLYVPVAGAKVGDSGGFNRVNVYADSSKATVVSHEDSTWDLLPDTANTAWFCVNISKTPVSVSELPSLKSYCYRINTTGTVLALTVTTTENGQTLVYK